MTTVAPVWTADHIPSLTGRTIIVTGANSGIGLEAATAFSAKGAHVVLAVRDEARGRDAAAGIEGSTEVRALDLADLASVRSFAESWTGVIDVLVNNAGVMVPPFGHTEDGFELQFGINPLGHFALTNRLLPHITGRVVTVASGAHRSGTIDFDDLNWATRRYGSGGGAYEQSKLANLLFTYELDRRLRAALSSIRCVAAKSNRAAIGATVTLHGRGAIQTKAVLSQSSFVSHSDLRLHFGLGDLEKFDKVTVRWPNGSEEEFPGSGGDRRYLLVEGSSEVRPLKIE
jgi:NAD(P)-dependent dehydrogenase (short-subunit alcohol dehydrogenase family)